MDFIIKKKKIFLKQIKKIDKKLEKDLGKVEREILIKNYFNYLISTHYDKEFKKKLCVYTFN